jgi:hypothetical protein
MRARIAVAILLGVAACAGGAPKPQDPSRDSPPADLKTETLVRCLIDAPDGCSGCDRGDTCVYKQMKEYDCVYIVYGTKCE